MIPGSAMPPTRSYKNELLSLPDHRPPAPSVHRYSQMPRGWNDLPPEMNFSVLNLLSLEDLKAFSVLDRLRRQLAIPTLFKVRASVRILDRVWIPTFSRPHRPSSWMVMKPWNHFSTDSRPDAGSAFDHSTSRCDRSNSVTPRHPRQISLSLSYPRARWFNPSHSTYMGPPKNISSHPSQG